MCKDEAWDTHLVRLILKPGKGGQKLADFRPIAVLPVIYKWYSRCLLELAKDDLANIDTVQHAFRPKRQAHEVISCLRNVVEKCLEWKEITCCILDCDISKAYDFTDHREVVRSCRKAGTPIILIAAWLREWQRMRSVMVLDDKTRSASLKRTRSLPQGDPAAPTTFNTTLDQTIRHFINICKR